MQVILSDGSVYRCGLDARSAESIARGLRAEGLKVTIREEAPTIAEPEPAAPAPIPATAAEAKPTKPAKVKTVKKS